MGSPHNSGKWNSRGYVFCTLERIGGTPAVIMGLGSVMRNNRRNATLKALMNELYHRALMAFPDEDVIFGTTILSPSGLEVFKDLTDELPRPSYRPSGEERAWVGSQKDLVFLH